MQPGDYIYGVETNHTNGKVTVKRAVISSVTAKQVKTNQTVSGFGLEHRSTHKREDVYATAKDALWAYREKVVQTLLRMEKNIREFNVTLRSIDELISGGEVR